MNERYLYPIFLSLSSSTDIFVFYFLMLNAHSLSRSRHFTTRRYAVLPRGVEGCGSSTTHIPFSDPTRRPPRLTFLTADHRPVSHLSHLSRTRKRISRYSTSLALFWQSEDHLVHWDVILLPLDHIGPDDDMSISIVEKNTHHHHYRQLPKCIYILPCLSSILLLLCMGEREGGTRLGMSSFLWRQSQFNSGQTKCLILEGGSLFA